MQKITLAKSFKTIGLSKVAVCSLTAATDTTGVIKGSAATTSTDGADTFLGTVDLQTAANSTLNAADNINGGLLSDTLKITTQGTTAIADATNGAVITNIETIEIRAVSTAGVTLSGTNLPGVTLINNNLSTDALTLTNLAATTSIQVTGNAAVTNGATTADYVAAATSGNLTITGGVKAGAIAVDGTGLTSLAITSSGAANTTGAISTTGTPTAVTINAATALTTTGLTVGTNTAAQSLTISGAGKVTLGTLDDDFATVTASGNTGGVVATLNTLETGTTTGSSGNDTFTTAAVLTTGSVAAGAGTGDTLIVAGNTHLASSTLGAKYTGFEVMQVQSTVTVDMDNITGITGVRINQANAGVTIGVTDLSAAQAAAVTIRGTGNDVVTIGVKNATTLGNVDTVTLTIDDGSSTVADLVLTTPTMAGVENLIINAALDAVSITGLNLAPDLTSVKINATHATETTTVVSGAIAFGANAHIDASGSSRGVEIDNSSSAAAGAAIRITGGSGNDTLTASDNNADIINGGAGLDVIDLNDGIADANAHVVQSDVISTSDADVVRGFISGAGATTDSFDYNGVLANGSGAAPIITTAEVVIAADIAAALASADAANEIVFIVNTDVAVGATHTAMDNFMTGVPTSAEAAAVVNAIVGTGGLLNGAIANLDAVLGASDSVLFQFSTDTDTFVFRITNTDATGNTLTASEVTLVAGFDSADLVAADYI